MALSLILYSCHCCEKVQSSVPAHFLEHVRGTAEADFRQASAEDIVVDAGGRAGGEVVVAEIEIDQEGRLALELARVRGLWVEGPAQLQFGGIDVDLRADQREVAAGVEVF